MVGAGSPRDYRPLAAAAAIAALQIDPDSAEAHAALGYVRHYEWQWVEAERELRRAIELNPSYALARIWYANLLMSRGRMAEAVEQVTIARDLDPFSLIVNTNLGWILHFAGRHEDAIERLEWTLDLDANYVQARQRLSEALADGGRLDAAVEEAQRMVAVARRSPASLTGLAHSYARAGREADARALVDEVTRPGAGYVAPGSLAVVHAVLGDRELALDWLERAFDEGSNQIAYLGAQPAFRALADHPRFQALLARAGLPSS
jgi:eukaryotic-like serine/threonine-protein kinase